MPEYLISPEDYLAEVSGAKPLAVSPEDYLNEVKAAPRFPPVGASAPAPKPVKAPASYQIQADEPATPKPVGPPMISTRRILRRKPALPESMQPTAIEKAADLIEGVPVVGPLMTAPVRLAGITPAPPQPAQTYEGEHGQSLDVGANWRPSGEMGNAADDVRSVRDNMLRQPFGMGEAIEKADVPWYAGGDLTKGTLKAASALVDSPEAMLTLGALPAGFHALKGGGVAPRAAVTAAELEFAKGGIESGLEAAQDPNKSFLEKAGEIGAQGVFAGGMIAGAGRTMRPEIARVESAVADVARDRTAKAQGLPFAPPEPTDIQRTWAQFRQLDPGERWQDVLSTLPDNDLKAAALGEENPFRKGMAAQEIKRRERLNVWRPTVEAPEQPLNRATRRETTAIPEPDLQMVADELGLGAFESLTPGVQAQVRGLRDEAAGLDRGPSVKLAEPPVVEPATPTGKQSLQVPRPAAPPLEMPPSAEYRDMRAGVQRGLENIDVLRGLRDEAVRKPVESAPFVAKPAAESAEVFQNEPPKVAAESAEVFQSQIQPTGRPVPGIPEPKVDTMRARREEMAQAIHGKPYADLNPFQRGLVERGLKEDRGRKATPAPKAAPVAQQTLATTPARQYDFAPAAEGEANAQVSTTQGMTLPVRYTIAPVEQIVTSFDQGYNPELQPRDTGRKGSRQRIEQRKRDLAFNLMADSALASDGAPITMGGQALTRNHGTKALAEAYSEGLPTAERYRQDLIQNAARFGYTSEEVAAMKNPALRREVAATLTPEQAVEFARQANAPSVAAYSDAEVGRMLADRMTGDVMRAFQFNEDGVPSAEFTRGLIRELPVEMQASFMDRDGQLSAEGLRKVRAGIMAKAFPESRSVETMAESLDNNVRNISNGMLKAAPELVSLDEAIAAGTRHDLGLSREIGMAADVISDLRNRKMSVGDWLNQQGFDARDPVIDRLVQSLDEFKGSSARIAEVMNKYADLVHDIGDPNQVSMFGDINPSKLELIEASHEAVRQRIAADAAAKAASKQQKDLFASGSGGDVGSASAGEGRAAGSEGRGQGPVASERLALAKDEPARIGQPDIQKAFGPKADVSQLEDGTYRVTRNGFEINVHPNLDYIEINPETVRRDYGRNAEAGERAVGRYVRIDRAGLIQLAKRGGDGAILDHEVFHAAMDMALTPSEKAGVLKRYGTEEAAAEAYSALKADAPAGLYFAKIRAFFQRMVDMVTGRAEGTLRKVARGDVWERGGKEAAEGVERYNAKPEAAKEPWQLTKGELVAWKDTKPTPKYKPDTGGGYSEQEMHERTLRNRSSETEAPDVKHHPVGSYGLDSTGELMQLREYKLDDPKLIFPEGMPNSGSQTVQKYADWINQGSVAPALTGLETEKGNIKIQEGHHRAAAIRSTGGDTAKVWVTLTRNRPLGNGQVMPEGVTHRGAVEAAIKDGKAVPSEVLADYPDLAAIPSERYAMRAEPLGILDPEPPQKPPAKSSAEAERTEEPRRLTISPNADESSIRIIEKSGLGEASQLRMVDAVDAYLKRNPERKVMSDEEYKDLARDVDPQLIWAIDPKRLTPGNMPPREVLEATRGVLSTVQTELDKLTKELEGPVLEADRPAKEAELTRLESDQQHLMDILFPVRSEHGRNLRLWGQMALDNLDPVAWIARARRMAGLPGGVALPGKVEGEITKALGDNRIAEADAIQQVTAIDRGKQKMKEGAEKPKPEKPVVELSREQRIEQARKQTIKRLQAELNGKRITDTLTPEERALIADDSTVKQLREQVHELRAKNKPIKTADEMVAAEIERERKRLSKVLEGEPVTARVDKLTPEQRKLVDADQGLQSLRARIQERRAQDRLKKQKTPEEKAVEGEVKRADTLTAKEDGTYKPKVVTKAELTPEQRARVNHDHRVLEARKRLFEAMKKSQRQSKLDVISMVRRAGLLTAPKTWLRNIGGNTAFAVSEELSRIPASIIDAGFSVVSGNGRTVQGMSLNAMRKATYEAATRGTQEFMDVMRDGATADQLAQFDFRREMNSGSKVLDTYVNTVMRFMSAQDRVFKRYAFERSLQEQMKLAGVDKPTEAMNAQAISDAEFATFNNRNKVAGAFSKMKAGMGDGGRFAVDMIVPFSQTPSNVILRGLDYTPIGAVGRMVGAAWKTEGGLTPELQRSISMAFGRGAVGSALLLTGYLLAKKNLATGNRPQNPAEARADETARRQWGAVKMGDHWRQLTAISPVGALITTGAAMYEAQNLRVTGEDEEEKRKKRLGHAGVAIVKTVEDMPMLQGVQMVDAWRKDPFGSGERVAGRMAGSFVPTIAADIAAAADPVRRDAKGFWAQVAARTPARLMLPEKVDALGKPIEQNRFAAIDPTLGQRAAEDSDPLLKAIVDEQMTFGVPPKKAGESEESYRFRLKVLGAAREFVMRSAMASDQFRGAQSWRNGSDERREILGDATRQAASGINKALGKDYKEQSAEEQMRRLREVADGLKVQ